MSAIEKIALPAGRQGQSMVPTSSTLAKILAPIYDAGWVTSYGPLADRYSIYRSMKILGNRIFNKPEPIAEIANWHQLEAVIDGFRHSGNSFIRGNLLAERREVIATRLHRPWLLKRAASLGLPVVVLIRDPLEVALSRHHRTLWRDQATYGLPNSVLATLLCWYFYYGHAWRLRGKITVLPFALLAADFQAARQVVEAATGPALSSEPSYEEQNRFEGPRPQARLSTLSRAVLWLCRRRYQRFLALAAG